mmetsp:Transcript_12475/g.43318  ORF Transcript_12475/g.43318 Transcript_12475/m.43318 type:complete len:256 (+) Transcript_12475:235-1002(+)
MFIRRDHAKPTRLSVRRQRAQHRHELACFRSMLTGAESVPPGDPGATRQAPGCCTSCAKLSMAFILRRESHPMEMRKYTLNEKKRYGVTQSMAVVTLASGVVPNAEAPIAARQIGWQSEKASVAHSVTVREDLGIGTPKCVLTTAASSVIPGTVVVPLGDALPAAAPESSIPVPAAAARTAATASSLPTSASTPRRSVSAESEAASISCQSKSAFSLLPFGKFHAAPTSCRFIDEMLKASEYSSPSSSETYDTGR